MIVGTAGHIDHGKSALVTALTGRAMDRLAEERRRGITIDLNFAPLELGDGLAAGVVDVPGHEDFVRTMVAGASGFDLALLVVAADEGIMPQTLEHLAIMEQLRVPAGIPVVTKADLVEPEWCELVALDLAERLRASPVAFDEPAIVSVVDGRGLADLRARLQAHARRVAPRLEDDLFRLPVDRAFSVAGVGTVVTGTAWSGSVRIGDAVQLLPAGIGARVRSIESHGRALERSEPGVRTAIGLVGPERMQVRRGDVLVAAGAPWAATQALDVEIALRPDAPQPLLPRTRVRLLLGTAEVMVRVRPREPVRPGERGLARLRLETPIVARGGDRFVLRSYSPVTTIGGGRVLDPRPPIRGNRWPEGLDAPSPEDRLPALVERRPYGVPVSALPVLLGVPERRVREAAERDARLRLAGEHWIPARLVTERAETALAALRDFHRREPAEQGMPLETLRRAVSGPDWLAAAVIGDLRRDRRIIVEQGWVKLAGFAPRVDGGDAVVDRIVEILAGAGLAPPNLTQLAASTGRPDVGKILRLAAARGRVEAVERDRYYSMDALRRFTEAVTELGRDGAPIQPAALRERLGISRKYLIPLLEWADGRGLTVRVGDVRRLASIRR